MVPQLRLLFVCDSLDSGVCIIWPGHWQINRSSLQIFSSEEGGQTSNRIKNEIWQRKDDAYCMVNGQSGINNATGQRKFGGHAHATTDVFIFKLEDICCRLARRGIGFARSSSLIRVKHEFIPYMWRELNRRSVTHRPHPVMSLMMMMMMICLLRNHIYITIYVEFASHWVPIISR